MITLTIGEVQTPAGLAVPNGSVTFQLNMDATIIADPGGFVSGVTEVAFQFDVNGLLVQPAQLWSNAELNPQHTTDFLATYYLVTFYDANGARLNARPMWWQFPSAAGTTVDISQMTPILTVGDNVIFYPTNFVVKTTRAIQFVIDGGGSVPTTGPWGQISIPYNCTIVSWTLTGDQSGSAVIDVLRGSFAAFPTLTTIAGTDKPTLSSAQKNADSSLIGWGAVALNIGDELQINLNSVTTCTRLNLTIGITVP